VNGTALQIAIAEAVLLSPIIHERLRRNPRDRSFRIETDMINSDDMTSFLAFVSGLSNGTLSKENELKFLCCCTLLGNDRLGLFVLLSARSGQEVTPPSPPELLGPFSNLDSLIDLCASCLWMYSSAELRCLSRPLVHRLLSSSSLSIQSEDALLGLMSDLDSETFEYWKYIEVSFLSDNGRMRYAERLTFDHVTSEIWTKVASHLRGVCSDGRFERFHSCEMLMSQSSIVATCPPPLCQFEKKKWKLLYRGTRDGFRSSDFHGKCDGCTNTVT
jgi:hypothetical protein